MTPIRLCGYAAATGNTERCKALFRSQTGGIAAGRSALGKAKLFRKSTGEAREKKFGVCLKL